MIRQESASAPWQPAVPAHSESSLLRLQWRSCTVTTTHDKYVRTWDWLPEVSIYGIGSIDVQSAMLPTVELIPCFSKTLAAALMPVSEADIR